ISADFASKVLALAPLGYWRFNESIPSPGLNKLTNSGSLGSAGDGYAVLDVIKGQSGIVGNCIRLNNTNGDPGYCGSKVDVPFNAALNPQPPFTIEFWAKPTILGDSTGLCPISSMNPSDSSGGNRSGYLFYLPSSGKWNFRLGSTSGYAGVVTASTSITTNV